MKRDDRNDPFDDIFREIERMMNQMMGTGSVDMEWGTNVGEPSGFGSDTHVDIHEDDDEVRVIADLPGVEKEDIDLKCDGEVLTVGARTTQRQYDERIRLPAHVDENSASASYKNGVLEVVMQKDDDSANISVE